MYINGGEGGLGGGGGGVSICETFMTRYDKIFLYNVCFGPLLTVDTHTYTHKVKTIASQTPLGLE